MTADLSPAVARSQLSASYGEASPKPRVSLRGEGGPVPVRASLRTDDSSPRTVELLRTQVAGVPLFERHLQAFRLAGIRQVRVSVPSAILTEVQRLAHEYSPPDVQVTVSEAGSDVSAADLAVEIEQELLTLVDPRLVSQLAGLARSQPRPLVCADAPEGEEVDAKSPYRVGVPEADEAKPVHTAAAAALVPIGLALRSTSISRQAGTSAVTDVLAVGRYYWQRVRDREDVRTATWKVLLATMKPTDGIYAQTNRRVSLRISRLLIGTPVTPNAVTIATLGVGLLAGWLLAQGKYLEVVAGSFLGWVASMLDGVDGELARARFQASAFGHWLEMICDYAFYILMAVGIGEGFHRVTGNPLWLAMGCAAAVGVVLGFAAVARLKRVHWARGGDADFYSSYEKTVRAPTSNPFARITSHVTVFTTRAAFPYYLVLFAILGLMKFVFVVFFVVTQVFWVGALIVEKTVFAKSFVPTGQSRNSIPRTAGLD